MVRTVVFVRTLESQSPQAGQFNSYYDNMQGGQDDYKSLNPLKRVNSILTFQVEMSALPELTESQSPQAGQFNSYIVLASRIN